MRARFDIDRLDADDPFELDEQNRPHLHKRLPAGRGGRVPVDERDILELYRFGDPDYMAGKYNDEADWLMIGEVTGIILLVPLAPPKSKDPSKCRPIGIYTPSKDQLQRYRQRGGDYG